MQLNADKCKELVVCGKELSVVNSARVLGVMLSSDLKWNGSIKKANKRLYFLVCLKRAGLGCAVVIRFYCTVIRPVLEYCAQVFHHSLPEYLSADLERVQKRALAFIVEVIHKQTTAIQTRLNKQEVPIIQSLIKSSI